MLSFSYALRGKYYNYWGFYMKKNNKFTLRRLIATLGMVLMLSLSLTGMTQPAKALPSVVSAATSIGVSTDLLYFNHYLTSATVTLSGGSSYAATPSASWIHPNVSGNKLTIYVDYLDGTSSRAGTVRVKSGSSEKVVYVIQYPRIRAYAGSSSSTEISSITIPGVKNKIKPVDTTITVRSIGKTLTATPKSPWLSVRISGSSVVITANPNTSLATRRGSVVLSNGYETKTITVIQEEIVPDKMTTYPYMGPTTFTLSKSLKDAYSNITRSQWYKLTPDQQKRYLSALGDEMKKFLGISSSYTIIFDYGTSPELNSKYSKLVDTDKGETVVIPGDKGVTYQDGHDLYVLLVTERLKESGTLAAATLIHECRHAWQGSIQKYNGTMMQYLLQYNNEYYISPLECESCYKKQFVEMDAFTYEEKLCAALNNALK